MRILLAVVLAVIAIGAGGMWALGQFGGNMTSVESEPREPIVREPEVAIAAATPEAAPPVAATPTPAPAQRSKPAAKAPAAAAPTPAPTPAPPPPPQETAPAAAAETQAAPAPPATATTPAKPNPFKPNALDSTKPAQILPQSAPPAAAPPAAAPSAPPATAEPPAVQPAAPQAPAADPIVKPQQAPSSAPVQAQAPAATSNAAAGVTPALAAQFKSRKVTYNRPPATLALDKAVDVSLVINATADVDAGKKALEGFQGTVVERDVDLSDTVSAQLTGVGFNIESQTVERQKLSGKTINRWQWRVTPTEPGTRTLILEIFGYESGSLDAEPLDAYRDEIKVEVQLNAIINIAKNFQPVFAILAALAGAISALVAFLRFRDDRKTKKAAKAS